MEIRLRTARRSMRKTMADVQSVRQWDAWARRLAGRYTGEPSAWGVLAAVWRRATRPPVGNGAIHVTRQYNRQPLHFHLNLRAAISGASLAPAPVVPIERTGAVTLATTIKVGGMPFPVETLVTRLQQREILGIERESRLVTRLLRQHSEQETVLRTQAWSAAPPVPRIVSQPAPATPVAPPSRPQDPPAPTALQYWENGRGASVPPPLDIERLTDRVIHSIDRRVLAARERLGKS